ncbi:hypothetical protein BCV73_28505 [Paenibacillus sp. SSG-1]|uniref:DUF1934 domain-containing protein n=1 Tax=Paenibacillus sp. SSG-1 TaxID=1443669 RepID=UPI000B7D2E72|nr:DUF1934 domain-containing protein [Paenibacillus sp. SSG-1]OXL86577.1 hypothetical protein BCV73_28505 [Paenibacillus sp. SSG-1]
MPDARKATVRLRSRHDGQEVNQEMTAQVFARGQALYVMYEEPEADLQGRKTKTTVKIGANSLKMIRHGAVESEHSFQEGQRLPGFYRSPYTSFNLSTDTRSLKMDLDGMTGEISWAYDLYVYEECTGHFTISFFIQEDNQS